MKKFLFLLSCFFLLTSQKVFAQTPSAIVPQGMRISPVLQELTLTPGVTSSYTVTVENLLEKPMGITTSVQGFTPRGESDDLTFSKNTSVFPIVSWTQIANPNLILGPHEKKDITIFISTPSRAKPGGYYEAIFLTPLLSNKPDPTHPVVETRVASLLFTTIGKIDYQKLKSALSISSFSVPLLSENPSFPLYFEIKNIYSAHILAKPHMTISSLFGKETTIQLTEKRVLASTTRSWKHVISSIPKGIGVYRLSLVASYGNGQQLQASRWLLVFPYVLFGEISFAILMGILIFRLRKRIKKAVITLFET